MKIQCFYALDYFDDCTLTIPEWIEKAENKVLAWQTFIEAAALYYVNGDMKLRMEPRVGYTPDAPFFIFKESNNGTTYTVSHDGVNDSSSASGEIGDELFNKVVGVLV